MADEVSYQQAPQVAQLLAERETASAYGQTTRVEAVDKQLAALGYAKPKQAETAAAAASERAAAAEDEDAKMAAPKGRTSRASKQQIAGG